MRCRPWDWIWPPLADRMDEWTPKKTLGPSAVCVFSVTSILWVAVYSLFLLPVFVVDKAERGFLLVAALMAANLIALFLPRLGGISVATWIPLATSWVFATIFVVSSGGLRSPGMVLFPLLILDVAWLLGERATVCAAGLFLSMTLALAAIDGRGINLPQYFPIPPSVFWAAFILAGLGAVPLIKGCNAFRDALMLSRRRAEELSHLNQVLEESEERLSTIVDAAPDGIFILNSAGRVMEVNGAALRQLGYSREELLELTIGDFVAPEFRARATSRFPKMEGETFYESRHVRKDGTEVSIELNTRKIMYAGEPAMLGIARDITERKLAEQQRLELERELQQAQKMDGLGKLASGIAHDFNNLLTVIEGCGSLISERMEPDNPLQKYACEILQASELAGGFTRQLLAFSRKQAVEFNLIDLNRVVEETTKMLRRMVGEKIELVLRLEPSPGTILADSGQLQQALLNLAVNAKDVMPNGGRLVIETASVRIDNGFDGGFPGAPPGHYLRLSVSDTGIGMDAETKRQIFEPFFTTKAPGRGTGLGLSIVYRIVRACNGRIAVSSELGKGATFFMIFPSIEAARAEPQRPAGTTGPDRRVER